MPIFSKSTVVDPDSPAAPLEAYKEGRRDERQSIATAPNLRSRGGSPLVVLLFLVLAAVVVGMVVMVVEVRLVHRRGRRSRRRIEVVQLTVSARRAASPYSIPVHSVTAAARPNSSSAASMAIRN